MLLLSLGLVVLAVLPTPISRVQLIFAHVADEHFMTLHIIFAVLPTIEHNSFVMQPVDNVYLAK